MKLNTIIGTFAGLVTGVVCSGKIKNKKIEEKNKKVNKFKDYYNMLNQWIINLHENKTVKKYFIENGYKEIAIYGMGEMGNRLYEELIDCDGIEIKYAIDKNAGATFSKIDVFDLDDNLPEVDLIVVSAIFEFDEIKKELSSKLNCPIVSLENVIYSL